ncbi:hypothetical protein [Lactobacillus phage Satyr]|jgi:hypothetical protein|uniref:Uncharacterized protein n=1 Tax=Lactobacillus phage Satyr TaxID=2070201 RepID=A0A2K9V5G0_9CAUD|nr:hypothetical protein HOS71_gp107 [Lactobacillus phage Satyr]AUV57352.1 hypothetical protein [Lactobacillus phage Satyr]
MLAGKYELDENKLIAGYNGDDSLSYDEGVIKSLESVDDILKYNMLVPYSDDAQKLAIIIYKIRNDQPVSDEESDFLDTINSRFIVHSQRNDLTKREIFCLFMNQYWDWSALELPKTKDVDVSFKALFSAYAQFCSDNHFDRATRRLKRTEFESYLSHYGYIKRTQRIIAGKKRAVKVILDLPSYKQGIEIPKFDLREYYK